MQNEYVPIESEIERFRNAGISDDERVEWTRRGFGPYAALNYRSAGATPTEAQIVRDMGWSSRTIGDAVSLGWTAQSFLSDLASQLRCASPEALLELTTSLEIALASVPLEERSPRWPKMLDVLTPKLADAYRRLEARSLATPEVLLAYVTSAQPAAFLESVCDGLPTEAAKWQVAVPHPTTRSAWQSVVDSLEEAQTRIACHQRPIDAFDGVAADLALDKDRHRPVIILSDRPANTARPGGKAVPPLLQVRGGLLPQVADCRAFGFSVKTNFVSDRFVESLGGGALVTRHGKSDGPVVGSVHAQPTIAYRLASEPEPQPVHEVASLAEAITAVVSHDRAPREDDVIEIHRGTVIDIQTLVDAFNTGAGRALPCSIKISQRYLEHRVDNLGDRWWFEKLNDQVTDARSSLKQRAGIWIAFVGLDNRLINLGEHATEEEAFAALRTTLDVPLIQIDTIDGRKITAYRIAEDDSTVRVDVTLGEGVATEQSVATDSLSSFLESEGALALQLRNTLRIWVSPASPLDTEALLRGVEKRNQGFDPEVSPSTLEWGEVPLEINGSAYTAVPYNDNSVGLYPMTESASDFYSELAKIGCTETRSMTAGFSSASVGRLANGDVLAVRDFDEGERSMLATRTRLDNVNAVLWWMRECDPHDGFFNCEDVMRYAIRNNEAQLLGTDIDDYLSDSLEISVNLNLNDDEIAALKEELG